MAKSWPPNDLHDPTAFPVPLSLCPMRDHVTLILRAILDMAGVGLVWSKCNATPRRAVTKSRPIYLFVSFIIVLAILAILTWARAQLGSRTLFGSLRVPLEFL